MKGYTKYFKWFSKNDVLLHCCWDISCEKLLDKIDLWRIIKVRNSLLVQWMGLGALTAKGPGSIAGQGTKILHATWHGQK